MPDTARIRAFLQQRKQRTLNLIPLCMAISFVLLIAAPLTAYCKHIDEYKITAKTLICPEIVSFFILSVLLYLSLYSLPERAFKITYGTLTGVLFLMFLQGALFNAFKPSTLVIIIESIIWISAAAASAYVFNKRAKQKPVRVIYTAISLIVVIAEMINLSVVSLSTEKFSFSYYGMYKKEFDGKKAALITDNNLTTISENRNVFIFCVDRFDRIFAEIGLEESPELFSELEGFTYFEDNISLYGHTYPSIAYMLTGKTTDESKSREEYFKSSYSGDNPLKTMSDHGYRVNVFTESYYSYEPFCDFGSSVSNIINVNADEINVRAESNLKNAVNSLRDGASDRLPHLMKRAVKKVSPHSYNLSSTLFANGASEYVSSLHSLKENISKRGFELTTDNIFSFIHTEGCHDLYFVKGNADHSSKDKAKTVKTLKENFDIINQYIRKMKEYGVYENATIIITGDHSASVNDFKDIDGSRCTALFVKPSGISKGALKRSSAQVCHADLWATIYASEGIKTKEKADRSVFEIEEDETVPRYYVWHKETDDGFEKMVYTVNGASYDFDSWTMTERKAYKKSLYA